MKIVVRRDEILDLEGSLKKEYLLTNGRGGYSSSTIIDCHMRKYHGLLNIPMTPYGDRFNLLSKLEAVAWIEQKSFRLSTNKFPGVYDPQGHKYMDSFEMDLFPVTTFKMGDIEITKSILMPRNSNTILVKYSVVASLKKVLLKLTPLMAYRNIHHLAHDNMHLRPRPFPEKKGFKIEPYEGMPALYMQLNEKNDFFSSPMWTKNFEYIKERNRGYDYQEDLFSPGVFEVILKKGESIIFRASTDSLAGKIEKEWDDEVSRLTALSESYGTTLEPLRTFKTNAEQYLLEYTNGEKGISAGYHWFGEWGRDTMISLAGLTMCTEKFDAAFDILLKYTKYEKDGALPNYFTSEGGHAYNSIDASLLYFRAVQQYIGMSGEKEKAVKAFLQTLQRIVLAFLNGKVPLSGITEKGFVWAGNESTNLTWMDARAYGRPVTPRHGCAIEINALWFNALNFLADDLGSEIDKDLKTKIEKQIDLYKTNFLPSFWNEEKQCLFDVYRSDTDRNGSIRPNQLFACGLPYTCIPKEKALLVIETVKAHLVTQFGLRTLSPEDLEYQADYKGSTDQRDSCYHQGMIWPWLIGIFADSLMKYCSKKESKAYLTETFSALWEIHPAQYCLQHISEIFKPNPPFTAKGAVAQAWSLAEVIRVLDMIRRIH